MRGVNYHTKYEYQSWLWDIVRLLGSLISQLEGMVCDMLSRTKLRAVTITVNNFISFFISSGLSIHIKEESENERGKGC